MFSESILHPHRANPPLPPSPFPPPPLPEATYVIVLLLVGGKAHVSPAHGVGKHGSALGLSTWAHPAARAAHPMLPFVAATKASSPDRSPALTRCWRQLAAPPVLYVPRGQGAHPIVVPTPLAN